MVVEIRPIVLGMYTGYLIIYDDDTRVITDSPIVSHGRLLSEINTNMTEVWNMPDSDGY